MQTIKIFDGHELADLADEEAIFDAADLNGIGITDALIPGVTVLVPDPAPKNLLKETIEPAKPVPTTQALNGQTWIDITLQQLGDEERIFELCDLNEAGITDELLAGNVITALDFEPQKKSAVNALKVRRPASSQNLTASGGEVVLEGIEYWGIEFDFIVS